MTFLDPNDHLQLGGIGLATMGTVFASAMFGALMAPVVSGAFSRFASHPLSCQIDSSSPCPHTLLRMFLLNLQYSSLSEQISDSEFELPELPFRALRHGNQKHHCIVML